MSEKNYVLAMYDVRGIQKYVFRTAKIRDVIGASRIVENIIIKALEYAVDIERTKQDITANLKWTDDEGVLPYKDNAYDITVLYIGGGNAFVTFSSEKLCVRINELMSYYVITNTYSLQLAVAFVPKTDSYQEDYNAIYSKLNRVKQGMIESKPLTALPIEKIDLSTGYPITDKIDIDTGEHISTETWSKRWNTRIAQKSVDKDTKILDNYVTKKGIDSTIAIIHIDGNNMGSRIKQLIAHHITYSEAVPEMRKISYQIDSSYKKVFQDMQEYFNTFGRIKEKENDFFVRKVLTAGDDITYICNGKIALETVQYFVRNISKHTMNGLDDMDSIRKYGFSVCAGIAYIHSHFPFDIGYEVAESACENAKKRAKEKDNMDQDRIGNWVDFQICKNIKVQNLESARENEYVTSLGEQLTMRPFFVPSTLQEEGVFATLAGKDYVLDKLLSAVSYFNDNKKIPRSLSKSIRNTYSLGEMQINLLMSFINSRNWKMPDGSAEMYLELDNKSKVAKWYDALEIMELYSGVVVEGE